MWRAVDDCNPSPDGRQYIGVISITLDGIECQAWASQSPHSHGYTQDSMFADGSVNDASNYCRNPDDDWDGGPFCYTVDPAEEWDYCGVPACRESLLCIKSVSVEITSFHAPDKLNVQSVSYIKSSITSEGSHILIAYTYSQGAEIQNRGSAKHFG